MKGPHVSYSADGLVWMYHTTSHWEMAGGWHWAIKCALYFSSTKSSMLHPVRGSGLMRCLSRAHESAAPEMHLSWGLWVLGNTGTLCHSPFQGPYSTTPLRNHSQMSVTLKIQMLVLFCLFLCYKVCILTPDCLLKPLLAAALSNVWGGRRSILCSPYRRCYCHSHPSHFPLHQHTWQPGSFD